MRTRAQGAPEATKAPGAPYRAAPFDTSAFTLTADLSALVEALALNVHEAWARKRVDDGWTYGPARDDVLLHHPLLVPYAVLSESDKAYDRETVLQTLMPLIALGYTIQRDPSHTAIVLDEIGAAAATTTTDATLRIKSAKTVPELLDIWQCHAESFWTERPELLAQIARRLLQMGQALLAYEAIAAGLRTTPRNLQLRQLQGLALARSGGVGRAIELLTKLSKEPDQTPAELEESLGILGGVYKSAAIRAETGADAKKWFALAHRAYAGAYRTSRGYYPGVNAATTALLCGNHARAIKLAITVRDTCQRQLRDTATADTDYYILATLGEVELLLSNAAASARWYRRAVAVADRRFADVASTLRNARLIAAHTGVGARMIESVLRVPRVVAFVTERLGTDARGTSVSARESERLSSKIQTHLADLAPGFGFSCAGAGPDLLFLGAMRGIGEAHVVLPYNPSQFAAECVAGVDHGRWMPLYTNALAGAAEIVVATDTAFADPAVLESYATRLMVGLARIQSAELCTELVLVVTSSRRMRRGRALDRLGVALEPMDTFVQLPLATRFPLVGLHRSHSRYRTTDTARGMIFADVVHSSTLTDEQQPLLIRHFLGAIGELVRTFVDAPLAKNTWGDGLYLVYDSVLHAGLFALALRDLVRNTDWAACGLRPDLSLRIAVHAGPVVAYVDPITGEKSYTGSHTVRAARIEPVTLPGTVYASREFAALAAAECPELFAFEPVGRVGLAKNAAVVPLFVLNRANSIV